MCQPQTQIQNQIISPQPVGSNNLMFKQMQQTQMDALNNINSIPSDQSIKQSQTHIPPTGLNTQYDSS